MGGLASGFTVRRSERVFYGLSYGGKTAMVPAPWSQTMLSICSADFNWSVEERLDLEPLQLCLVQ